MKILSVHFYEDDIKCFTSFMILKCIMQFLLRYLSSMQLECNSKHSTVMCTVILRGVVSHNLERKPLTGYVYYYRFIVNFL